jgi:sulfate adenylyltransferase subunit 2
MQSLNLLGLDSPQVWDTESAHLHLKQIGQAETRRSAERKLRELGFLPSPLQTEDLQDEAGQSPVPAVLQWEIDEARRRRRLVLFAQLTELPDGRPCLYINDARGAHYWVPLAEKSVAPADIGAAFDSLQAHLDKPVSVFPHGRLVALCRNLPSNRKVALPLLSYPPVLDLARQQSGRRANDNAASREMTHLDRLEAESIYILRDALAQAENPAMLYSIGKDSSVMLHLARKAFFPATPPFPLLHVDTRWKFREMYLFRDFMARESGMDLLVHINPDAVEKNINPFEHGSKLHTDITKTEGLKQALAKYRFDVVFGGARRDEEKSRAKERIFSFRTATQRWDPKNQRPELWNLFNAQKGKDESIRVFPLSNWTELDIWQYIYRENIPIVPLYFARERPVVVRDGMILMVDDERMTLLPDEQIQRRKVRFRTLGCYPLSGAIDSDAETLPQIILELLNASTSERQGRLIDSDSSGSMERKKQEGYF